MIDNYDSFTYNLAHYFQALNQEVMVIRNDEITLEEIAQLAPDQIVISPGPKNPDAAGISLAVIARFKGIIPILGVCLGQQCIAQHFGAKITHAEAIMHGKTSKIQHNENGLFTNLLNPLTVTRYHSLIVDQTTLPDELIVTAWHENNGKKEIMALQHTSLAIVGVQFHPESILTEQGHDILQNFLDLYTCKPSK